MSGWPLCLSSKSLRLLAPIFAEILDPKVAALAGLKAHTRKLHVRSSWATNVSRVEHLFREFLKLDADSESGVLFRATRTAFIIIAAWALIIGPINANVAAWAIMPRP